MSFQFTGTGVALATPFNDDYTIDFEAFGKLIDHTIAGKVEYLVALGTTGESATLSKEEKKQVIDFVVKKASGKVPVVVGFGGNFTQEITECIQNQDFNGISGVLSVSPYYNKPSQEGIFHHFKAIAQVSPVPVIVYNVPGRTGSNISWETTVRIANECKNVVAVKEASGNIDQITKIIMHKPKGFEVLSGDDALTFSMLNLGAKGVISVVANSHPKEFSDLVRFGLSQDLDKALENQFKLYDFIAALFTEGSPGGLKAALNIMGMCKNIVRPPLYPVSNAHYNLIKKLLVLSHA